MKDSCSKSSMLTSCTNHTKERTKKKYSFTHDIQIPSHSDAYEYNIPKLISNCTESYIGPTKPFILCTLYNISPCWSFLIIIIVLSLKLSNSYDFIILPYTYLIIYQPMSLFVSLPNNVITLTHFSTIVLLMNQFYLCSTDVPALPMLFEQIEVYPTMIYLLFVMFIRKRNLILNTHDT